MYYASLGWSVVPTHKIERFPDGRTACSCPARFNCVSKGKHPAVSWLQYQQDRPGTEQLRIWFTGQYSTYGVGIITGAVSSIFVVDVDEGQGKVGGETLADLQMIHGDLPHTVQARTGGGGRHMIFRHPGDIWVTTAKNVLGPGVDVRGDGGFIVAAPSMHESGLFYLWDETAHPRTTLIVDAPLWLLEMAETPPPEMQGARRSPTGSGEIVRDAWGKVIDGRERHMVGIVCGVIATHIRDCGLLPSVEEVIKEAWPSYERTTKARSESLEQDARGQTLMRQRATHMLRRAASGKWKINPFTAGQGDVHKQQPRQEPPHQRDKLPPILPLREFMDTFRAPDYLVDGIVQRSRLHALTSPTGHGKTAVVMYLGCLVAMGRNLGAIEVTQGNVLFLAGENSDDVCGRFWAACQEYGMDPDTVPLMVMPDNFPLDGDAAELLKQKINATGLEYALIIGDSVAAYFPGDDENSNTQMGTYARHWRVLTTCNGRPGVVALAHPVKNADRENLTPRGGGAFIAELDVNLTAWAEGERTTTSIHWHGKIRGADFQPVVFALTPVTLAEKRDAKGRAFVSVVAHLQTAEVAENVAKQNLSNENVVLEQLRRNPDISLRNIALNAGWVNVAGKPAPGKVQRLIANLKKDKLVRNWRGKWRITKLGRDELAGKNTGEED